MTYNELSGTILEVCIDELAKVHTKQVLTYLRITGMKLGLLINFGEESLKDGVRRIINGKLNESE